MMTKHDDIAGEYFGQLVTPLFVVHFVVQLPTARILGMCTFELSFLCTPSKIPVLNYDHNAHSQSHMLTSVMNELAIRY